MVWFPALAQTRRTAPRPFFFLCVFIRSIFVCDGERLFTHKGAYRYEQEKAKLADTRAARDTLAARTLAAIRELQFHCAQLERSGSSRAGENGGGAAAVVAAEEGVGNGSSNAGSEARPTSDHLAAALLEVGGLMASLRREHEAAKQAGNQDWTLRRAQYESEAKALRVNLDAAHKRV
jgi:hypothetical protein